MTEEVRIPDEIAGRVMKFETALLQMKWNPALRVGIGRLLTYHVKSVAHAKGITSTAIERASKEFQTK